MKVLRGDDREKRPDGAGHESEKKSADQYGLQGRGVGDVTQARAKRPGEAFGRQSAFEWRGALPAIKNEDYGDEGECVQ